MKQLTITDIRFNGTQLRIQDNEKGRYFPPDQPSKEEVQKLVKQISDIQKGNFSHAEPQLIQKSVFYESVVHINVLVLTVLILPFVFLALI